MAGNQRSVIAGGLAVAAAVTLSLLPGARPALARTERCGSPAEAPGFEVPARRGIVPDVRCMDLQLAQDKLEVAGFLDVESRDASGQGRYQVVDRNWVVVAQTHAPGRRAPKDAQIRLETLRYGDRGAPRSYDRSAPGPLPRLLCFDLQEADDTLESIGFYRLHTEDASGDGRGQFAWRNWTVVAQSPDPGGRYDKNTLVRLGAVKDNERPRC